MDNNRPFIIKKHTYSTVQKECKRNLDIAIFCSKCRYISAIFRSKIHVAYQIFISTKNNRRFKNSTNFEEIFFALNFAIFRRNS